MKENQENVEPTEEALEEAQPEAVEIRESDETPAEEAGGQEPAHLSAESVTAILADSGLDDKARKWLEGKDYKDEAEVKGAVAEMEAFIAEIAPHAGEPFALGETATPAVDVPKLLSREELEERARERARRILSEIEPTYAVNL